MKAKEIQDLINFLSETGLAEVDIETENFKIRIKRNAEGIVLPQVTPTAPLPVSQELTPATPAPLPQKDTSLVAIKSPMIGTFYSSKNPESAPFVQVGSTVKKGDIICIIEAMKLFNEIESEVTGKIVEVLVSDSQPVEYDEALYLIDPS